MTRFIPAEAGPGDLWPAVPRGGYAASPAFRPDGKYLEFLTENFDLAVEILWPPSSRPTLDGVLDTVAESSRLLVLSGD